MSRRNDTVNIPDFHAFLRNVIRQEQRKLAHFKLTDDKSLFFFEDYSWDWRAQHDFLYGPYSSYQKCFDASGKSSKVTIPKPSESLVVPSIQTKTTMPTTWSYSMRTAK